MKVKNFLILIIILLTFVNCFGNPEEKAQKIYAKAQALENEKKTDKAFAMYNKLLEYKDTKTYKEANTALEKRGLSIGRLHSSATIKTMIIIQNKLMQHYYKKKYFPSLYEVGEHFDAWDQKIKIKFKPKKNILLLIISPGKDHILGNADDIVLAQQGEDKFKKEKKKKNELQMGLNDLVNIKSKKKASGERRSNLSKLKKFKKRSKRARQKRVDLDKLINN